MKAKFFGKNALIAVLVFIILLATSLYMSHKTFEIPYDGNNIILEQQGDDYYVTYHGKGNLLLAYTCNNLDEGECEIVFYQTLWDRYISPLFSNETSVYKLRDMGKITKFLNHKEVIWTASDEETSDNSPISGSAASGN